MFFIFRRRIRTALELVFFCIQTTFFRPRFFYLVVYCALLQYLLLFIIKLVSKLVSKIETNRLHFNIVFSFCAKKPSSQNTLVSGPSYRLHVNTNRGFLCESGFNIAISISSQKLDYSHLPANNLQNSCSLQICLQFFAATLFSFGPMREEFTWEKLPPITWGLTIGESLLSSHLTPG